jgi:hypothetical protein
MLSTTNKITFYTNLVLTSLTVYNSKLGTNYINPEDGGKSRCQPVTLRSMIGKNIVRGSSYSAAINTGQQQTLHTFFHASPTCIHSCSLEIKKQVRKGVSGCHVEWGRRQERVESYTVHDIRKGIMTS